MAVTLNLVSDNVMAPYNCEVCGGRVPVSYATILTCPHRKIEIIFELVSILQDLSQSKDA